MTAMLMQSALRLRRAGRHDEAAELYLEILKAQPDHFEALCGLAAVRSDGGDLVAAERLLATAISIRPSCDIAYHRARILERLDRIDEAMASLDAAIALKPDHPEALILRGRLLGQRHRHTQALADFDTALAAHSRIAEAWIGRAAALTALERWEEALSSAEAAIALSPSLAPAWQLCGLALRGLRRGNDALVCLDKALARAPDQPSLLLLRADLLFDLERHAEAATAYQTYLSRIPNDAAAWRHRGMALSEQGMLGDALACFSKALVFAPGDGETLIERGLLLFHVRRFADAAADFEEVLKRDPDCPAYVKGYLAVCRLRLCDWRFLQRDRAEIAADIRTGKTAISPFGSLALGLDPGDTVAAIRLWARDEIPPRTTTLWRGERYRHDRIRVAYLSADFRQHVVARMIAGVFEHHDKTRFETIGLSFGPDDGSLMRARVQGALERFIDVSGKSDFEAAALLREMEADIAVDLTGWTRDGRPGILALRPAPIQASYLGFPATMGIEEIDYILADRIVIPEKDREHYCERAVYLPHSYLCNDSERAKATPHPPSRIGAGLPPSGTIFCCFNNSYKFTPEMFGIWMRLLHAIEGSVLWLPQGTSTSMKNLQQEASARGIAPERLVFAPYATSAADHLARLGLADLMLDTLPYNAHATACDALWAGVPLVTCAGQTFAGRVAASALSAVGLPELIADTLDAYEALALKLARDRAALAAVKAKLARNRDTHPLFDTGRFTRNLEAAYLEMWQLWQRNEKPAPIDLSDRAAAPDR